MYSLDPYSLMCSHFKIKTIMIKMSKWKIDDQVGDKDFLPLFVIYDFQFAYCILIGSNFSRINQRPLAASEERTHAAIWLVENEIERLISL